MENKEFMKKFAKDDGYSVTKEDVLEALREEEKSVEISDEELSGVAGGIIPVFLKNNFPEV